MPRGAKCARSIRKSVRGACIWMSPLSRISTRPRSGKSRGGCWRGASAPHWGAATGRYRRPPGLWHAVHRRLSRRGASRFAAVMPSGQRALDLAARPHAILSTLVEEGSLPLRDNSVDRLLVVHCLEVAEQVKPLLRELWRVAEARRPRADRRPQPARAVGARRHDAVRPAAAPTAARSSTFCCTSRSSRLMSWKRPCICRRWIAASWSARPPRGSASARTDVAALRRRADRRSAQGNDGAASPASRCAPRPFAMLDPLTKWGPSAPRLDHMRAQRASRRALRGA